MNQLIPNIYTIFLFSKVSFYFLLYFSFIFINCKVTYNIFLYIFYVHIT